MVGPIAPGFETIREVCLLLCVCVGKSVCVCVGVCVCGLAGFVCLLLCLTESGTLSFCVGLSFCCVTLSTCLSVFWYFLASLALFFTCVCDFMICVCV